MYFARESTVQVPKIGTCHVATALRVARQGTVDRFARLKVGIAIEKAIVGIYHGRFQCVCLDKRQSSLLSPIKRQANRRIANVGLTANLTSRQEWRRRRQRHLLTTDQNGNHGRYGGSNGSRTRDYGYRRIDHAT
jgi:hypothetical protein